MNEDQAAALAALPGGLRAAVGQRLSADEDVAHAIVLCPGADNVPPGEVDPAGAAPHALVVTDHQFLLVSSGPRDLPATVDTAVLRLACRREELIAVELRHVLLRAQLTITWAERGRVRDARVRVPVQQLDEVCAVLRHVTPVPTPGTAAWDDSAALSCLAPWMQREARSLCWSGEYVSTVLHAPPRVVPRPWWRRWTAAAPEPAVGTIVVTDRRIVLLEQPAPPIQGGPRFEHVATVWALDALEDVRLESAGAEGLATVYATAGRDRVGRTYAVAFEPGGDERWRVGLAALLALRRPAPVPRWAYTRHRFVAETGLGDLDLTDGTAYAVLLRHVEDHQRLLAARGQRVTVAGAAQHWRRTVYEPAVTRLRESRARVRLPERTLADLYLRLCEHKWLASERVGHDIGLDTALQDFERWAA